MRSESISHLASRATLLAVLVALIVGATPVSAQRDRTPPTAPVLSVTDVGATHVVLQWTASTDNQPFIFYQGFTNGNPSVFAGANTFVTVTGLTPSTTYVFTVKARDNGINWSPASNAVSVTTAPPDSADTTPPTSPTNLTGFDGGCGENYTNWTPSTDNVDAQFSICYDVFVNGIFRPESSGYGLSRTVAYAVAEGSNTFEIFAIDSAGNRSTPATMTIQMSPPC